MSYPNYPNPSQPGNRTRAWIIAGVIAAVAAIVAIVLVIVLNRDDEDGQARGPAPELTCAPGEYGIKVGPDGEAITCEGGSESPGGSGPSGGDGGASNATAAAPSTGADGLLPLEYHLGSWKVSVQDPTWTSGTPQEQVKAVDAFEPEMNWSITGACAAKDGCSMNVDLGTGTTVPVSYDVENEVFVGTVPYPVTCQAGSAMGELQVRLYDYNAGSSGTAGSLVLNSSSTPCDFGQGVYLFDLSPA